MRITSMRGLFRNFLRVRMHQCHRPLKFILRLPTPTFQRVALDLEHRAFPELSAALRQRADRILGQWRLSSLKAMPHLDRITLGEFENSILKILYRGRRRAY